MAMSIHLRCLRPAAAAAAALYLTTLTCRSDLMLNDLKLADSSPLRALLLPLSCSGAACRYECSGYQVTQCNWADCKPALLLQQSRGTKDMYDINKPFKPIFWHMLQQHTFPASHGLRPMAACMFSLSKPMAAYDDPASSPQAGNRTLSCDEVRNRTCAQPGSTLRSLHTVTLRKVTWLAGLAAPCASASTRLWIGYITHAALHSVSKEC
jgi:hypothetical protein